MGSNIKKKEFRLKELDEENWSIDLKWVKITSARKEVIAVHLPFKKEIEIYLKPQLNFRWALAQLLIIVAGIGAVGFISYHKSQLQEDLVQNIGKGVGGFEAPLSKKNDSPMEDSSEKAKAEKDELLKDKLMGIPDKTPEKSEKESGTGSAGLTASKQFYVVKPGDTLSEIAEKYNVTVASIAGSSQIRIPDDLRVGQKLQIPTKDGFFYTIKKNERLAQILSKHKVSLEKFLAENPGINLDFLEPGDEVFLPGAKPQNLVYGWLIPVSSRIITSGYGWRRYPRRQFHKGIDLKAPYVSVRAPNRGVVTYAGRLGGYGNAVIIAHPNGYRTLYGHLSRIYVRRGQRVNRGRILGRSGNTGYSFGPHLHFEVTRYGKRLNPLVLLKGLRYKRRR